MDHDHGSGPSRPPQAAGPPEHPLRRGVDDPPPPRREQLPLPRRARQGHIEPQLRVPGGHGDGTPFAAFAPDLRAPDLQAPDLRAPDLQAPDLDPAPVTTGDRAAEFREGTARGRVPRDDDPATGPA